jgi:hypothetical protein
MNFFRKSVPHSKISLKPEGNCHTNFVMNSREYGWKPSTLPWIK